MQEESASGEKISTDIVAIGNKLLVHFLALPRRPQTDGGQRLR
jgi:hypothetical protein